MSQEFLSRILEQKAREVEKMEREELKPLRASYRLAEYLKNHQERLQIIAEVKKASPSMGDINLDVDIVQQAQTYEANGAVMISVLTDEVFFKGHLDYLREISSQVQIPTLNKDFIIDEKQIIRARNAGATVILLIVAVLSEERLKELYDYATELGLEVLVETHNLAELVLPYPVAPSQRSGHSQPQGHQRVDSLPENGAHDPLHPPAQPECWHKANSQINHLPPDRELEPSPSQLCQSLLAVLPDLVKQIRQPFLHL